MINSQADIQYSIILIEYFCFIDEYKDVVMNTDIPGILFGLLKVKDLTIQSAVLSFIDFNFTCEKLRIELKKQRNFTKLMELLEGQFIFYFDKFLF